MRRFDNELLQRARLELGLTQEEAASRLGIDARSYRRYESGAVNQPGGFTVRYPSRRRLLQRICDQFGLELDELVVDGDERAQEAASAPGAGLRLVHPLQRARHFVGDPAAAAGHLAAARRWTAATGEAEVVLRCFHLAASIALAAGDRARAEVELGEGLRLADGCGFGLFAIRLRNLIATGALGTGDRARARDLAGQALQLSEEPGCGYRVGSAVARELLARCAV